METKEILKSLRKSKGFTNMKDFCEAIDISINTYQNYESGKRIPTADILIKLADFYGVTTDYLLGRPEAKPPEDPVEALCNALNISQEEKQLIVNYFNTPSEMRLNAIRFLSKLTSND